MKKILILSCISLCFINVSEVRAQDPEFTQFYANPLYLNPAFAGTHNCPRATLNYRNQWPALSGVFVTTSASYDQYVSALQGGLGLLITSDQAGKGTLNTTRVSGIYAVQVPITRKFSMRFGAEATYFQRALDWTKLTFGDQIDPRRGFIYTSHDQNRGGGTINGFDVSAGILGFSENFFAGVAVHHLNRPNESLVLDDESAMPIKLTGHLGAKVPLTNSKYSDGVYVSPNLMYRQQGGFQQLNMGLYITKGVLTGGVWYRNRDAFILTIGIKSDVIQFGYSYDLTISKLGASTGGAHELGLMFNFDCKPPRKTYRTISCPSF